MSSDLRTEINDCEATTGFIGDGPVGTDNTAGFFFEGTNAITTQHDINDEHIYTTEDSLNTGTFSLNWSDSTIYLLVKDNLLNTEANGGAQIVIGDGTDRVGFAVGGNDNPGMPLSVFWNAYKLDVTERANAVYNNVYAGVLANLTVTAITQVGYGSVHLAKAQGNVDNVKLDNIRYIANGSYALRINGGTVATPETMADVVGDDKTNGWGMIANPVGSQYTFWAPTEWGEPSASANVYFQADNEQWFWLGGAVGATHFPFRVIGNATDTISFVLNNVVIVNTGTRAQFNLSDTNVNVIKLSNVTFTDLGAITLQVQDVGNKFIDTCVFNNCDKITISNMDLDDCIFNGTTDADGAILLDENSDKTVGTAGTQSNLVFNSDGTGHAVHLRPTGAGPFEFDLDNWKYTGYANDAGTAGNRAFYINPVTSTVNITLNILNNGDTPSVDTTGYTGTLTINNSVTVTVSGVSEGTAVKVIANETVGTITTGDVLGQGLADSNGEFSFTLSYESAFDPSGLDVIVRCRNHGFPNAAIADDGGSFTNQTTASNSSTADDMSLLPPSDVAINDAYYFGHNEEFSQIKLELSQVGIGAWTITWEYWNGSTWSSLSATDGTNHFTQGGIVSWTIPGNWADTTINSQGPFKYVRARVTVDDGAPSQQPLGRWCKLDVTRYLPFSQNRIITSAGLDVVANWAEDTISIF